MPSGGGLVLALATHNRGKAAEFQRLFAAIGVSLVTARSYGLAEPAETAADFAGNAAIKARHVADAIGIPALADDSGLCVPQLGGAPGVRTADWCLENGRRDSTAGMGRLRDAVVGSGAVWPVDAEFRCALALAVPDGSVRTVEAVLPGRLVWPPRGTGGHGFDPMFCPQGASATFAELSAAQKDAVSHRRLAFDAMVRECFT